MPLKGVPKVLTPHLLQILSSMGHGDEIVLADAHFPSSSVAKSSTCQTQEIRLDACPSIPLLLEAILKFFPLDQYDEDSCVMLMDLVPSDKARNFEVNAWKTYQLIVNNAENKQVNMRYLERFEFYERAKKSYAIVHTGFVYHLYRVILFQKPLQFYFSFSYFQVMSHNTQI